MDSRRTATHAWAALALLLAASAGSDAAAAEKRCRGGKEFFAGQCHYPDEIQALKEQAARDRARVEQRRQAEARREAEERARRDRAACEQARAEDTIEGWQRYSTAHPDGECEAEAMGRITLLRRQVEPEPEPAPPPGPVDDGDDEGAVSPLVYVGFGLAAAGLATWGIAGGISLASRSILSDECPDDVCAPEQQETIDRGEAAGHAATAGLIVGLAGAALGVVGFLLPSDDEDATAADEAFVAPLVGPGIVGVQGRF